MENLLASIKLNSSAMNVLPLEYRKHLSETDLTFITNCFTQQSSETEGLLKLLTDPNAVDSILDQSTLLEQVLNTPDNLELSPRLYFYLLTRHSLKASGLDSPELADYISGVLASYLKSGFRPHVNGNVLYLVDWLQQVDASPIGKRFELYVMAGNHLLFLTGIFPHFIERRTQRHGAPDIGFYESIGQRSFRSAAQHPLSRRMQTEQLYHDVAMNFASVRTALNDLSERLISLETA